MKELPAGVFVLIIILGVIVLAAVLYCVWAFIEPNLFEVTERKLSPALFLQEKPRDCAYSFSRIFMPNCAG